MKINLLRLIHPYQHCRVRDFVYKVVDQYILGQCHNQAKEMILSNKILSILTNIYRFCITTLSSFDINTNASVGLFCSCHLGIKFKFQSLFCQNLLEGFAYFHINTHTTNMREKFYACHFGTQTTPYGTLEHRFVKKNTIQFVSLNRTNSSPMTPAPIKTIFFGTCLSERAPVDETMASSSIYIRYFFERNRLI